MSENRPWEGHDVPSVLERGYRFGWIDHTVSGELHLYVVTAEQVNLENGISADECEEVTP